MPEFAYQAREASGRAVNGVLSGADEQDVLGQLTSRGLFPSQVKPAPVGAAKRLTQGVTGSAAGKVPSGQLAMFYSQLSDLLTSGVPLLRSLALIEGQTENKALRAVLGDVIEQVSQGKRLTDAFRRHPRTFRDFVVSLVEAGEEGSFLEDVLERLAVFTTQQNELRAKVTGSLVYPVFLIAFGTLVVGVMVVEFVPRFQPIFDRMEARGGLPWATTTLMGISDFLQSYWVVCLAAVVAAAWGLMRYRASEAGALRIDRLLLSEFKIGMKRVGPGPLFGSLGIARFCRALGTLLKNGVPMLRSLEIAKNATGNAVLAEAVASAAANLSSGKSLAGPLRQSGRFPASIIERIAVGEESNSLDKVLVDIADSLERQTARQLDLLVRMLEPVMLLALAAVVLFIVAALLLPILQSSNLV
ncbi:MAG: type II secretion system F family protein [Planctomycetota bacterium]